jgi:hypothetical protein
MSNPNFSAGVNILLERMETNPEDFEMHDFNHATMTEVRGRFYEWGSKLKHIITGKNKAEVLADFTEWHMLTREEHNALLDGYKAMMRRKMDAEILTRLMDTEYVQRQKDAIDEMRHARTAMYNQAVLRANPAQNNVVSVQPTATITTSQSNGTSGGLLNSIGLGGLF